MFSFFHMEVFSWFVPYLDICIMIADHLYSFCCYSISNSRFAAPTLIFVEPLTFILFLYSFPFFLRFCVFLVKVMSYKSVFRVILLCIIKRIKNPAKPVVLPPPTWFPMATESNQIQRWQWVWFWRFGLAFSAFGTAAFSGWRTWMAICFLWSKQLVMNFLVQTVTVSFIMAAVPKQPRKKRVTMFSWIYFKILI